MNIKKVVSLTIGLVLLFTTAFFASCMIFKRPMFSIIISVYNYADYLPDTLDSVLTSTYSDYEIIIVNDGSTDNSQEVMEYYASMDNRIKLITQENQGLSVARNNAMKVAKGRYLWFVDADDFIVPNALEKMANAIQISVAVNNGSWPDILSFLVQMVDETGTPYAEEWYTDLPEDVLSYTVKQYDGRKLPIRTLMRFPVTSGKQIYRADYLKEKDIIFPPRQVFEDDVFFYTTQLTGAKGIVIPEKLYFKRNHGRSIVNNRPKYYDSVIRLPMTLYKSLTAHGVSEDIAMRFFEGYSGSIYYKWQQDAKHIPELEKLLRFIDEQPLHEFWLEQSKYLRDFIHNRKSEMGLE